MYALYVLVHNAQYTLVHNALLHNAMYALVHCTLH